MAKYENIVFRFLQVIIAFIIIGTLLYSNGIITINIFSYTLYFFGVSGLILYIYSLARKYNKIGLYDILMYILAVIALIATIFAENIKVSLLGYYGWNEGLYALLCYYIIFLVARNLKKEYFSKIIYTFLTLNLISFVYAVLQIFNAPFIYNTNYYITGIFTHCNFFAAFSVLATGMSVGLFLKKKNIWNFLLIVINIFGIFLSNSTTGFVGLLVIMLLLLIRKKFRESIIIIILSICIFLFVGLFIERDLFAEFYKIFSEIFLISNDLDNLAEAGTYRGHIYTETIKNIPNNLLNGLGLDNFTYIDDGRPIFIPNPTRYVTKAHSELLQILISQGIFAFVGYIILYLSIIINYFKNNKNVDLDIIFIGILAYLVQAQFNISIIFISPVIFLFLGILSVSRKE